MIVKQIQVRLINSLNSSQEKFDINHILNLSFALKICLFIKELYFLTSMLCWNLLMKKYYEFKKKTNHFLKRQDHNVIYWMKY